ncbi:MAG: VOC family protein [Bacteroidota bacterium]
MLVTPYLTFNGNCLEAMTFYKKCLGGTLTFQTVGSSPLAAKMPARMKKAILHATLVKDNVTLMASDMVSDKGLTKGNAVSIMLDCNSEAEIRKLYKKLSQEGKATQPLENTFFGALLGGLTDKYSNNWLLHFNATK